MNLLKNTTNPLQICRDIYYIESRFVSAIFDSVILLSGEAFSKIQSISEPEFLEPIQISNQGNEYHKQILSFKYNNEIPNSLKSKNYILVFTYNNNISKIIGSLENPTQISIDNTGNISILNFHCNSKDKAKTINFLVL